MLDRAAGSLGSAQEELLGQLENYLQADPVPVADARKILRRIFLNCANLDDSEGTIGDALTFLSKDPTRHSFAAIVLLRALAVPNLVPDPNSANQIVRLTVELSEAALPEIVSYLKIDHRDQNYEKFKVLIQAHDRISNILQPLTNRYGDLDALLKARHEIIGCLSHSIVRQYGDPYRVKEVRSTVEAIFGKLKKVSALDLTLLTDVDECDRSVQSVRCELAGVGGTFLSKQYLAPFIINCGRLLSEFLETLRGRFAATISWGSGSAQELQKRYPMHEPNRQIQVVVPLRNSGPGMAIDVRVSAASETDGIQLNSENVILGNVQPGAFAVTLDATILAPSERFLGLLNVEWGEIGNPNRFSEMFEFGVIAQSSVIDWRSLEYYTPYSTEVARGESFIGRVEKVRHLSAKLLRRPMEPFYITGQKRVGKTSLALAAAEYAKTNASQNSLDYHYILWGAVAHVDPSISLRQLGESVENFILKSLPDGLNIPKGNYDGSLAALIRLSETAARIAPNRTYVIILDEFDEIHQELFLQGNLAETFFANLRALSRCDNICVVLIGGENMPFIMDRQGQKLNNYSRINLSYFDRTAEWSDFQLVVRTPTNGVLNWHEDAISEVFNITNGNPYFTKIVCAGVLRSAISNRDADVTAREVSRATEAEISVLGTNSFVHLWQDGVLKSAQEREPDILRRMRVLVALARCLRQGLPTTAVNIATSKASASLSDAEISPVLNDFIRREVLREEDRSYVFGLPIFRMWLVDVGVSQLIADALNEELANSVLAEENKAVVRSEELVKLCNLWPTYRGKHTGTDEIKAWYQQVESPVDQRILFKLLARTRFFSEALVRERVRSVHSFLRPSFPEFTIRKSSARRRDIILTYLDGDGKSGASHASVYAEENGMAAECVISQVDFSSRFAAHEKQFGPISGVIVVDDIAATGRSLMSNVGKFLEENAGILKSIKVRIVTLAATATAQSVLTKDMEKFNGFDVEFRTCEVLEQNVFAFPTGMTVWSSANEAARAKALCTDLGSAIYKNSPLGFGGMGLLVVFPTTVPNNSLPILHSYARAASGRNWKPLFPRTAN
ncbi:MAG: phosphoribosyltransferase-like protein [Alphaproteobacteria bacterium]